ncbi:MAG: hypothetical protein KJ578_04240 [Bacteroidetes bacterium]|nr:hypothetical protein [Bacteroidota bacterium]MBU1578931.1 hypothetical protein [Bacteroidota bacterium]MBU2556972.1 hypothetical protein [Bacteroidota bacterium]
MDGFHYYNLFETKGAEYLLTIVFFLLLIPFWIVLNRKVSAPVRVSQRASIFDNLLGIPQEIYLAMNHTWVQLMQPTKVRIGLNDLIVNMVGENQLNFFRQNGELVNKGDLLAQIGDNEKKLQIFAPVSGIISGLNPRLQDQKMIVGEVPYESNWMVDINPKNWQDEARELLSGEAAKNWLSLELGRMRDFFSGQFSDKLQNQPVILQDGGEISPEILSEMPAAIWNDFQQAFLSIPSEN